MRQNNPIIHLDDTDNIEITHSPVLDVPIVEIYPLGQRSQRVELYFTHGKIERIYEAAVAYLAAHRRPVPADGPPMLACPKCGHTEFKPELGGPTFACLKCGRISFREQLTPAPAEACTEAFDEARPCDPDPTLRQVTIEEGPSVDVDELIAAEFER